MKYDKSIESGMADRLLIGKERGQEISSAVHGHIMSGLVTNVSELIELTAPMVNTPEEGFFLGMAVNAAIKFFGV